MISSASLQYKHKLVAVLGLPEADAAFFFFDFSIVLGVTSLPLPADRFFLLFLANDLVGFFPLSFLASDFCVASEIKETLTTCNVEVGHFLFF